MLIVDAHLDLAYNVARGRDPRVAAKDQPAVKGEIATVGLPDLREGNVGLICATIFCIPAFYRAGGYTNADEARKQALDQLNWYRGCVDQGLLQWVKNPSELAASCSTGFQPVPNAAHGLKTSATGGTLPAILLMEGADAMRSPADVQEWFDAGLRIVGL